MTQSNCVLLLRNWSKILCVIPLSLHIICHVIVLLCHAVSLNFCNFTSLLPTHPISTSIGHVKNHNESSAAVAVGKCDAQDQTAIRKEHLQYWLNHFQNDHTCTTCSLLSLSLHSSSLFPYSVFLGGKCTTEGKLKVNQSSSYTRISKWTLRLLRCCGI